MVCNQAGRWPPRLRRKDTLLVQQNIRASHMWRLLLFLFPPALPQLSKGSAILYSSSVGASHRPLVAGKGCSLVSTNGSMWGFTRRPLSYLCSPFSQRIAGQVSIWGLISPKYGISFSTQRTLSTLLFICPPPTLLPVSS